MTFVQRIVANLLTLVSLTVLFPTKVQVLNIVVAISATFVLTLLNLTLEPFLKIITLPITLMTLGLFSFIINAFVLEVTAILVPGLAFSSFWMALVTAFILSLVNQVVINNQ